MDRVAALSHKGKRRRNNEDAVLSARLPGGGLLLAVADGVGGERAGEVASRTAVRLLEQRMNAVGDHAPGERLAAALRHANTIIWQRSQNEAHLHGMATTVVAAVVRDNKAWIANVGDSRAYLLHGGAMQQLTRDHSLVAERVREGELTEDEAKQSRARHVITRSVGSEEDLEVDVYGSVALAAGSRLLLCSDGLYDVVDDTEIAVTVADAAPDVAAARLIDLANEHGGPDNISVVIYAGTGEEASGTARGRDIALDPPGRYALAGITTTMLS